MMNYFLITFFVLSLFQAALLLDVENEDENSSSEDKMNISASRLLRAIDYLNNVFNENSFHDGLSDDQQRLISFIIRNFSNNPEVMSSMERIKGKLMNMAANLKDEEGYEDLLQTLQS